MQRGETVRSRGRVLAFAVWSGLLSALMAGTSIALIFVEDPGDEPIAGLIGVIGFQLAFAAAAGRLAVGCARAGVVVSDAEVTVRGPIKTWRVPLAEVDRFVAGLQAAAVGNPAGGVVLTRKVGPPIAVWALAKESLAWKAGDAARTFEGVVAGLNQLVEEARIEQLSSGVSAAENRGTST